MEIIAPSGKFCTAMPIARAKHPASVIHSFPASSPANVTPTTIPSGILWSVTAMISIRFDFNSPFLPSFLFVNRIVSASNAIKNTTPRKKPTVAGTQAIFPCSRAMSMAGSNKDQTDAATITPAANPSSAFCSRRFISFLRKKTMAAPSVVPTNGIMIPAKTSKFMSYHPDF